MKKLTKKKKRRILIVIAFLVLIGAAVYTVAIQPLLQKENWVYKEETVSKGTLTVGVAEGGNLEYGITSQLYDLNLTVSESSSDDDEDEDDEETVTRYLEVEEVYVAPGQRITEGEPILKFTNDSISDVRKLLQAALADAKVTYVEAQTEYTLSNLQAQLDYESAMLSKEYADTIYVNGKQSISDNITLLTIELQQLQDNRETLLENYETSVESYQEALENYVSAKESIDALGYDNIHVSIDYQKKYLNAKSQYESATERMEQALEKMNDNEEKIAGLVSQIEQALEKRTIEELENEQTYEDANMAAKIAELEYAATVESLKEDLTEAEDELNAIIEQLSAFEEFVGEEGIVYAIGSGMVTEVGYEAGDSLIREGVIVSFAKAEDMTITVDVSQEDIVNLAIGDDVKIEFSAYPDTVYEGIISAMVTTETSAGSSTVSYPVTISVQGDTSALYSGMTADITFVTEEKENVLYVSRKAIVEENGKTYVYTDNALGQKVLCQVQTGISNGVSTEIISGLDAGDKIYIRSQASGEIGGGDSE